MSLHNCGFCISSTFFLFFFLSFQRTSSLLWFNENMSIVDVYPSPSPCADTPECSESHGDHSVVRGTERPEAYMAVPSRGSCTPSGHDCREAACDECGPPKTPGQIAAEMTDAAPLAGMASFKRALYVYNERGIEGKGTRSEQQSWHWREFLAKREICERCAGCSAVIAPSDRYYVDLPRSAGKKQRLPRKDRTLCKDCFVKFLRSKLGNDDDAIAVDYKVFKKRESDSVCILL